MRTTAFALLLVACCLFVCAPAHAQHCAGGYWRTYTVTTFVPGHWEWEVVQVGWHNDGWGNVYPIWDRFDYWVPGRYVTYSYQRWVATGR